MDYFSKNKILGWIIIIGLIINIAAISTILYKINNHRGRMECRQGFRENPHEFIRKELNLSSEQEQKFKEIRDTSRAEAKVIFLKMREDRRELLKVLTDKNPDTLKVNKLISEIEKSQSMLLRRTVEHYLQLKHILREEQYQKLNLLFMDMFGCDKPSNCKKTEDGGGRCEGKDDGGCPHRHRQE